MQANSAVEVWKNRMLAGNRAFEEKDLKSAVAYYRKAGERAKVLLEAGFDCEGMVAALMVSYHNLADALLLDGQRALAMDALREVHRILIRNLNSSSITPAQRFALLDGCHRNRAQISLTVRALGAGKADD